MAVTIDTTKSMELLNTVRSLGTTSSFRHEIGPCELPTQPGQLSNAAKNVLVYMFAREMLSEPVEDAELRLLLRGGQTMEDVRALMCQGRVDTSDPTWKATMTVVENHPSIGKAEGTGVAAYMQAGTKMDFARITHCIQAGRLEDGEKVTTYVALDLGAGDADFLAVLEGRDGTHIALDSYSNGPPVHLDHHHTAARTLFAVPENAGFDADLFHQGLTKTGPGLEKEIGEELDKSKPRSPSILGASSSVSRDFATRAADETKAYSDENGQKQYSTGLVAGIRWFGETLGIGNQQSRLKQQTNMQRWNTDLAARLAMKLGASEDTAKEIAPQILNDATTLLNLPSWTGRTE